MDSEPDRHSLRRRIEAAQALGGFGSVEDMAAAINEAGFGDKTIRRVMYGQRELKDHEAALLAAACGLTPEFFTADLSAPATPNDSDLARLESKLEDEFSLYRGFIGRVADIRTRDVQAITDKLDQVQRAVEANGDDLRATLRQVNERLADVEADQARLAARARPRSSADAGSNQGQGRRGRP